MQVNDVQELSTALMISGFGAYSPESLERKHPEKYAAIMQRFAEYVFMDDITTPYETIILYKRPWQSLIFIVFSFLALVMWCMAIAIGFEAEAIFAIAFGSFPTYYAWNMAMKLADRTPQIVLNNDGIQMPNKYIPWHEMENFEITQGTAPYLKYGANGIKHEFKIQDLMVKEEHLNHLIFIYRGRHKRDNPNLYKS